MENENWKQIPIAPLYEVSNLGRVRSVTRQFERKSRTGNTHTVTWGGRLIGGWIKRIRGRPVCVMVSLRHDGNTILCRVHRLVLEAFVGPCPAGMEGCHNDGNPSNNCVENLRWDTHQANVDDMVSHKTKVDPPKHFGERHPNARLSDSQVEAIRATKRGRGVRAKLARQHGVSATSISRIWDNVQRANNGPKEISETARS